MDFLWSPWRYAYVSASAEPRSCVFCVGEDTSRDRERLVLYRAKHNFVILNRFPYTSGHLMVTPYRHVGSLVDANPGEIAEMISLSRSAVETLQESYEPDGYNIGMNLGHCAGAGVRDHLHMHVVPRWCGDVNFMTSTGETRVLPEGLDSSYDRLKPLMERILAPED